MEKANAAARDVQAHDVVTGVCNRTLFGEHLGQGIERAKRHGQVLAVLILDVDGLESTKHALGRETVDELLNQMARVLTQSVRKSDVVGRIGDDQFAVMLDDIGKAQHAFIVAGKIADRMNRPWTVEDREVSLKVGVGAACYPDDGIDVEALLMNAAAAAHAAKRGDAHGWQASA
jgi:diguanylate cyclase (GGDEF)-like protein